MPNLEMYRDNTRTVSTWVTLNGVGVDLAGCTLWFTVKYTQSWKTDPDAAALLQLSTLGGSITVVPTGTQWVANTTYAHDALAMPAARNGLYYAATTGGTSGASEPTWPTVVGGTVTDNTVTWTCLGTTGHAFATILPAMTKALVTDGRFTYDWKLLDPGGVITTTEVGTLHVIADVTRAGD